MSKTPLNQLCFPQDWKQYRLIDCGDRRKLEQFGQYILIRPEPQAIWPAKYSDQKWHEMAHAEFVRKPDFKQNASQDIEGGWKFLKNMPEEWIISYENQKSKLKAKLRMTGFGHVGIFPEQSANWDFLQEHLSEGQKALNLFAYTGMATLAARQTGANVTHIDSVKNVVNWSRENMELSKLQDVRWIVEDAFKFVSREVTRGNSYDCIILDPPAYGRGPKGEKWILEDKLDELMKMVKSILNPKGKVILNLYSLGYSPLLCYNILSYYFPDRQIETGELVLKSETGFYLPLSVFGRVV